MMFDERCPRTAAFDGKAMSSMLRSSVIVGCFDVWNQKFLDRIEKLAISVL